jgi:transcriptional regulator with XRE-family HTH domain
MEPKKPSVLRKFRKGRNISTKEMSEALGCTSHMISGMEYGHKPIGELWARRFAQFFDVENWEQFLSEVKNG